MNKIASLVVLVREPVSMVGSLRGHPGPGTWPLEPGPGSTDPGPGSPPLVLGPGSRDPMGTQVLGPNGDPGPGPQIGPASRDPMGIPGPHGTRVPHARTAEEGRQRRGQRDGGVVCGVAHIHKSLYLNSILFHRNVAVGLTYTPAETRSCAFPGRFGRDMLWNA